MTWDFHADEVFRRVEIILSALVNDSDVAVQSRIFIGQDSVELVEFERGWILGVLPRR